MTDRLAPWLMRTVREATFDVWRRLGLTTIFANPGSTEISLLTDLPDDLRFVLALHESSVIGLATGWAIARREPALAIVHTTAGLGNAVGALATARVNRAPLVVVVGQQDRRHLAAEPFLAGKLHGLAGEYPVWVDQPVQARDVPGAIARAYHEAVTGSGPALVIVPMDDWEAEAGADDEQAAPQRRRARARGRQRLGRAARGDSSRRRRHRRSSSAPAPTTPRPGRRLSRWPNGSVARCGRSRSALAPASRRPTVSSQGICPPTARGCGRRLRRTTRCSRSVRRSSGSTPSSRARLSRPGTRVAMVSQYEAEVHRSAADLAVLADPGAVCAELAQVVPAREGTPPTRAAIPPPPAPPAAGEPLRAGHVLAALAERLPSNAIVIEESPSSRPELLVRLPARESLGSLSPGDGRSRLRAPCSNRPAPCADRAPRRCDRRGRLFALLDPVAVERWNLRRRCPVRDPEERRVRGDGQARRAPRRRRSVAQLRCRHCRNRAALGCPARTIAEHGELLEVLDEVVPGLADRDEPLLLEIVVAPDESFAP